MKGGGCQGLAQSKDIKDLKDRKDNKDAQKV